MSWEQITTWLDKFTSKPLVYGIFIVLVSFGCAFILFSQTSIGKKSINKAISLHQESNKTAKSTLKKVEDVEKLATENIKALKSDYEQKANDLKQDYEQKSAALVSIVNYYVESLFDILSKVPNAKVQNEIDKLKENYKAKKEEIVNVIGVIYQDYNQAIKENENSVRKEYDEKIKYLENQIAQITLYFSEIKKEEESNDGEREETINSNPKEETLQDTSSSL